MADHLSQQEINNLLAMAEDEIDESVEEKSQNQVIPYGFSNDVSYRQLSRVRYLHETMRDALVVDISNALETLDEMVVHAVEQVPYGEFLMSLPSPTHFTIFTMDGGKTHCALEINPSIVFPMIDRYLGAMGSSYGTVVREFTNIEINTFNNIIKLILNRLEEAWSSVVPNTKIEISQTLSSPNIFNIVDQNETTLMVIMEIIAGQTSGMMNICYPLSALENGQNHFLDKLNQECLPLFTHDEKASKKDVLARHYDSLPFVADMIYAEKEMTLHELSLLRAGDQIVFEGVAPFSETTKMDVDIEVNGVKVLKRRGE